MITFHLTGIQQTTSSPYPWIVKNRKRKKGYLNYQVRSSKIEYIPQNFLHRICLLLIGINWQVFPKQALNFKKKNI